MFEPNSLKFIKQSNGNVLLLKKETNHFIASFIPSLTIERDKDNLNRFEVMSQFIDYRSVDCDSCTPVIVADNFDEFLIELSEKFFFLNKKGCCNKFGRVTRKDKGINNCVLNTGDGLEAGDIVSLWPDLNTYWETAIYHGGDLNDNNNFEPLTIHNMGTNCPVYDGQIYGIQGSLLEMMSSIDGDQMISTVNLYFNGVLHSTQTPAPITDPAISSIANSMVASVESGTEIMIEHILTPNNGFTVRSQILRHVHQQLHNIITSETVTGIESEQVINTLTFIMPNENIGFRTIASYTNQTIPL